MGRQRWSLLAIGAALLLASIAPQAAGQTQPGLEIEPVSLEEPLAPEQTTRAAVNASVSCDGWSPATERAVAVFSLDANVSDYETGTEPSEVEVPLGPLDCPPGERRQVSSTLWLRPTRNADPGDTFSVPISVVLEEHLGGDTIREHGPYSEQISFRTGFLPDVEVELADELIELGWRETAETRLRILNDANGPARVDVDVEAPRDVEVELDRERIDVADGERAEVMVRLADRSSNPFGSAERTITLDTRAYDPSLGPQATDSSSLTATPAPWHESTPLLKLLGLGAGLAIAALASHRHAAGAGERRERRFVPPVPAERGKAGQGGARSLEHAWASWLLAVGVLATVWGTTGLTLLLVVGLLALAGGIALLASASLPEALRARSAALEADRVGSGLLGAGAAGLLAAGLGLDLAAPAIVAVFAGAWALARGTESPWAAPAVLAALVVFGLMPMLADTESVVVGAFGSSLFAIPLSLSDRFGELLVWLPFLAPLAVLFARTRRWGRAAAWVGLGLVFAMVLVPRLVSELVWALSGPGASGSVVAVTLALAMLASLAWFVRDRGWVPEARLWR